MDTKREAFVITAVITPNNSGEDLQRSMSDNSAYPERQGSQLLRLTARMQNASSPPVPVLLFIVAL
jgi:hypothetical protein